MESSDIEASLSSIWVNEKCETLWLNGDSNYRILLPRNIMKNNDEQQRRILESLLLSGCEEFKLYYGGDDNLQKIIADGLGQIARRRYELAQAVKEERKQKREQDKEEANLKKLYIQKYYAKETGLLYEAVLVAGKPCFVIQQQKSGIARIFDRILLPDATNPTMELLPPEKEMYLNRPFEYRSEAELSEYLKLAGKETLDSLYQTQKALASKYIDASNTHITMVAADDIFTFFQDKLGQTHYDVFVGDNDTGKTTNLVYLQYEGYRAMLDVDITPANIYSFLGNFEEGQGIILEDEADDIHKKAEKMKIYKAGYNSGQKVTRTDITNYGRKTTSWNTYSFKAFTMEELPDFNTAKGFMDRCLPFHCTSGSPQYDIKEVTNPAGDTKYMHLLDELIHNQKLLFAFRLLHYQDPLPNIALSVKNREKQLCKPLLRLFQDSECQAEIGMALADKLREKRGIKRDTLESKILDVITKMIAENQKQEEQRKVDQDKGELIFKAWEPNRLPVSSLIDRVRIELDGEYKREKDKSFETEEHGIVSHDRIRKMCIDKFGAESKRNNSIRYLEFDLEKLDKAITTYTFPEIVTILQKNISESGSDASDADQPNLTSTKSSTEALDEHEVWKNGDDEAQKDSTVDVKKGQNASPASPQDSESGIQESGGA
jgi:hypothetical protein